MNRRYVPTDPRDAAWMRHCEVALLELTALGMRELPVESARPSIVPTGAHTYNLPTEEHAFNSECLADVEAKLTIRKTTHPMIREAFFDGISIGKVAKNPYGLGWVASCNRKYLYWSIRDAALALYEEVRE